MESSGSESFEEVSVNFLIEIINIHILGYFFLTLFRQIEFEGAISNGRIPFHTKLDGNLNAFVLTIKVTTLKHLEYKLNLYHSVINCQFR
jgi:hypothetical protein